jgi:hypothetical protein
VRVELISDEDPLRQRIGLDGPVNVGDDVGFRAGGPDRRADHLAGRDVEVCDQRQGAVPDILELDAFDETI